MTMPKPRNPVAVASILLVLAASTALRFFSWHVNDAPTAGQESLRRLAETNSDGDALHQRTSWLHHMPDTAKLIRALRQRRESRERKLRGMQEWTERRLLRKNLEEKREVWVRGSYHPSTWHRYKEVKAAEVAAYEVEKKRKLRNLMNDYEPLVVCDRPADVPLIEDFSLTQKYSQCPEFTRDKPVLLLEGQQSHGQTGLNLVEFLHAIQEARDNDGLQLGIKANSWAMNLLTKMWMAIEDGNNDSWDTQFERAFCVKIFHNDAELEGWDVRRKTTKELLYYKSETLIGEYMESQMYSIRTLFRNYNTGEGHDKTGRHVSNMCSGINSIFGEGRSTAIYSVIHSRSMQGDPGLRMLGNLARTSGCDPVAALEMRPEYIKAILEPLGMMKYPIAFITDNKNPEVLERLLADPQIGPLIRLVPEETRWIGGDLTLAIMSNVFIGNPASTFSGFIAKSRLALGFGHNYLFRRQDMYSVWTTACGDHCIFDKSIIGVMA